MSSYYQSATRRSSSNSNSKTSSSSAGNPFCKVCYDARLPVADYSSHFVKDQPGPGGKVVCPTLLAQKCFKCGVAGHTSSYCPEESRREREYKDRERETRRVGDASVNGWKVVGGVSGIGGIGGAMPPPPVPVAAPHVARGIFGILAVDDSPSCDDSSHEKQVPKPIVVVLSGPMPPAATTTTIAKPLTWAQRAAAAATKAPLPSAAASSSSSVAITSGIRMPPIIDSRFQLHALLCHNIEVSHRAPSAKKAAAAANHRGNAAAVAMNNRKQESVTIPA